MAAPFLTVNPIDNTIFQTLLTRTEMNDPKLTEVKFESVSLSDEQVKQFATALKTNTKIQKLTFFINKFSDDQFFQLAAGLCENNGIQEFVVKNNPISPTGAQFLAHGLKNSKSIRKVMLVQNDLTDESASHFAQLLDNKQVIDLSYNKFGSKGAECIAKKLVNNTSLLQLNLSSNALGDAGINYLATAIKTCNLVMLKLNSTEFLQTGFKSLLNGLIHNKTIQCLELGDNALTDSDAGLLVTLVTAHQSLNILDLKGNKIRQNGIKDLKNATEKRKSIIYINLDYQILGSNMQQVSNSLRLGNGATIVQPILLRVSELYLKLNDKPNHDKIIKELIANFIIDCTVFISKNPYYHNYPSIQYNLLKAEAQLNQALQKK